MVSLSDSHHNSPDSPKDASNLNQRSGVGSLPILGDFLALFSALFYALYVTLLKVRIRSESRVDMQLFFGFVGLFNVMICWPMGFILHFAGVERFELPSSTRMIMGILINVRTT